MAKSRSERERTVALGVPLTARSVYPPPRARSWIRTIWYENPPRK